MSRELADFVVPIRSGLTPVEDRWRLDPDRAAELHRRLAELSRARAEAEIASHYYLMGGESS